MRMYHFATLLIWILTSPPPPCLTFVIWVPYKGYISIRDLRKPGPDQNNGFVKKGLLYPFGPKGIRFRGDRKF